MSGPPFLSYCWKELDIFQSGKHQGPAAAEDEEGPGYSHCSGDLRAKHNHLAASFLGW